MNYQTAIIPKDQHEALLKLAEKCNTGSELFYVKRSPDFFALSEEIGETTYFGVWRQNLLIGCIAISKQMRVINNQLETVYYLHDCRIDPQFQKTRAFSKLIHYAIKYAKQVWKAEWMFATILDTNEHWSSLIAGKGLLPGGEVIGETFHRGVPLFWEPKKAIHEVINISADEAWEYYKNSVDKHSFARFEEGYFKRDNGIFLAIKANNEVKGCCKLVDQSKERMLCAAKALSLSFVIVNSWCKVKKVPPLPKKHDIFQHAYLAYFVCEYEEEGRDAFIRYIYEHYRHQYTYLFFGLSEKEAGNRRDRFSITLKSKTMGYGNVPSSLQMKMHELIYI